MSETPAMLRLGLAADGLRQARRHPLLVAQQRPRRSEQILRLLGDPARPNWLCLSVEEGASVRREVLPTGAAANEPAEAALVATLEDEVVVVDEQPRYHVPGCEALNAQEPIPLPAREAVELGFTPCGWCRPDHTLASRYPAHTR